MALLLGLAVSGCAADEREAEAAVRRAVERWIEDVNRCVGAGGAVGGGRAGGATGAVELEPGEAMREVRASLEVCAPSLTPSEDVDPPNLGVTRLVAGDTLRGNHGGRAYQIAAVRRLLRSCRGAAERLFVIGRSGDLDVAPTADFSNAIAFLRGVSLVATDELLRRVVDVEDASETVARALDLVRLLRVVARRQPMYEQIARGIALRAVVTVFPVLAAMPDGFERWQEAREIWPVLDWGPERDACERADRDVMGLVPALTEADLARLPSATMEGVRWVLSFTQERERRPVVIPDVNLDSSLSKLRKLSSLKEQQARMLEQAFVALGMALAARQQRLSTGAWPASPDDLSVGVWSTDALRETSFVVTPDALHLRRPQLFEWNRKRSEFHRSAHARWDEVGEEPVIEVSVFAEPLTLEAIRQGYLWEGQQATTPDLEAVRRADEAAARHALQVWRDTPPVMPVNLSSLDPPWTHAVGSDGRQLTVELSLYRVSLSTDWRLLAEIWVGDTEGRYGCLRSILGLVSEPARQVALSLTNDVIRRAGGPDPAMFVYERLHVGLPLGDGDTVHWWVDVPEGEDPASFIRRLHEGTEPTLDRVHAARPALVLFDSDDLPVWTDFFTALIPEAIERLLAQCWPDD